MLNEILENELIMVGDAVNRQFIAYGVSGDCNVLLNLFNLHSDVWRVTVEYLFNKTHICTHCSCEPNQILMDKIFTSNFDDVLKLSTKYNIELPIVGIPELAPKKLY